MNQIVLARQHQEPLSSNLWHLAVVDLKPSKTRGNKFFEVFLGKIPARGIISNISKRVRDYRNSASLTNQFDGIECVCGFSSNVVRPVFIKDSAKSLCTICNDPQLDKRIGNCGATNRCTVLEHF